MTAHRADHPCRCRSTSFGDDITSLWSYEASVEQYRAAGGTSRQAVTEQIARMRAELGAENQ